MVQIRPGPLGIFLKIFQQKFWQNFVNFEFVFKVKHLIKDDARSEDSKDADEAGSKSRRKQQTKISDHVVTSFMAPKNKIGDKSGKKKFNLSSTEEDEKQKDGRESESSEDNDTGSPDFKCRISGSRKRGRPEQASKSDQSEDEDDRKVKKGPVLLPFFHHRRLK